MVKRNTKPKFDPTVGVIPTERLYIPPALPVRSIQGHKGLFGRVLVVGGDEAMFGAATLAATAALRTGSGLVQVAVPSQSLPFALCVTPELIGLPLQPRHNKLLLKAADVSDVLVLGPGMGQSSDARGQLLKLIAIAKPKVIDADALNILSKQKKWPKNLQQAILTPHPGEMLRLCKRFGVSNLPADEHARIALARRAATEFGTNILLKGHRTIVTDGRRVYVNHTGNSTLSKAGSGDVLSGVIGSLIGQGMPPFEAGCAGAWLHGKAGELAGQLRGNRSALARDVIEMLGAAIASYPTQPTA